VTHLIGQSLLSDRRFYPVSRGCLSVGFFFSPPRKVLGFSVDRTSCPSFFFRSRMCGRFQAPLLLLPAFNGVFGCLCSPLAVLARTPLPTVFRCFSSNPTCRQDFVLFVRSLFHCVLFAFFYMWPLSCAFPRYNRCRTTTLFNFSSSRPELSFLPHRVFILFPSPRYYVGPSSPTTARVSLLDHLYFFA